MWNFPARSERLCRCRRGLRHVSINVQATEPAFDLKAELFRIAGIDLTDDPGISTITAHTRLGQTCRGSAMPLLSHPGLGSALRNKSAEERSSPRARER